MEKSRSEKIDYIFNKVLPKKFIIVVLATIFTFLGILTGTQWIMVAGAYASFNFGQKIVGNNKNGNRSIN